MLKDHVQEEIDQLQRGTKSEIQKFQAKVTSIVQAKAKSEASLLSQVRSLEKELASYRGSAETLQEEYSQAKQESRQLQLLLDEAKRTSALDDQVPPFFQVLCNIICI